MGSFIYVLTQTELRENVTEGDGMLLRTNKPLFNKLLKSDLYHHGWAESTSEQVSRGYINVLNE